MSRLLASPAGQHLRPPPFSRASSPQPQNSIQSLDLALHHLSSAIAALRRAGQSRKSEIFWVFAAGSWSRREYEAHIEEAGSLSPKRKGRVTGTGGTEEDVVFAEVKMGEAVRMLEKGPAGEERDTGRDAADLLECCVKYWEGHGW